MKIMIPTLWLGLLLIPMLGYAQSDTINWTNFELTGGRFKTTLIGIVSGKPDWPYYVGGAVVAGAGVYFGTRDQEEGLPVLTVSDDALSVFCGSTGSLNVLANDVGEGMQVTAVTQPSGATVMTGSGGNILITNIGNASFSFIYTVTDRAGQTATGRVEVAVSLLPISAVDDAFSQVSNIALTGNVLMNDAGTQINVISNTFPSGGLLALAANGQFTFNAAPDFCGTTSFSYTIADGCNQSASATVSIAISDNIAPVITCPPPITVPCGSSTDPSETGTATGMDNCTAVDQLIISYSDQPGEGALSRTWTVKDLVGNMAMCTQIITIVDNIAPVITCPPAITVPCGSSTDPSETGTATGMDNCTAAGQLIISYSDQPGEGALSRTWTAKDLVGNMAMCTQIITIVDNVAPVITCPPPITVQCGSSTNPSATGTATATDNCTPTGQIAITFTDQTSPGQIVRIWEAEDLAGNPASCTQIITIVDNVAPVITCPPPITVQCGSSTNPSATGTATATDNCTPTGQIVISFSDQTPAPGCDRTIMRIWMALDLSGNASSCTQLITISDTDAPVISCPPDVTVPYGNESDLTITGQPVVSDPCGNPVSTTFSDNLSDFSNCTGMIVRNWVAMDDCGNSSVCQQSIFVEAPYSLEALDITPPSTPTGSDGMVVLGVTPNSVILPMVVFVNGVFHSTANSPVFIVSGLSAGNHTFRIIEAFGNGCTSNEIMVFIPFMNPRLIEETGGFEWQPVTLGNVLPAPEALANKLPGLISANVPEHPALVSLEKPVWIMQQSQTIAGAYNLNAHWQVRGSWQHSYGEITHQLGSMTTSGASVMEIQSPVRGQHGQLQLRFSTKEKNIMPYISLAGQWQGFMTNQRTIFINGARMLLPGDLRSDAWQINLTAGLRFSLENGSMLELNFPILNPFSRGFQPHIEYQRMIGLSFLIE